MTISRTTRAHARRGVALFPVLVCLVIAGILCAELVRSVTARRLWVREHARRSQADWIAASALERARTALRGDVAYKGETWTLTPTDLDGPDDARAVIEVSPEPGRADVRRVVVRATYPASSVTAAQRTLTTLIKVPPRSTSDRSNAAEKRPTSSAGEKP